jgi:hypothetical protein
MCEQVFQDIVVKDWAIFSDDGPRLLIETLAACVEVWGRCSPVATSHEAR